MHLACTITERVKITSFSRRFLFSFIELPTRFALAKVYTRRVLFVIFLNLFAFRHENMSKTARERQIV